MKNQNPFCVDTGQASPNNHFCDTFNFLENFIVQLYYRRLKMYFESLFFNGMNRGGVVTAAASVDLEILQGHPQGPQGLPQGPQGLPLSGNGIEDGWEDGGGGSPEENSDAAGDKRGCCEQEEEAKKLRRREFSVKFGIKGAKI